MNDNLTDLLSREMRRTSADTSDCPSLMLRVAAGVHRRRRQQRAVVAGATLTAVAILTPALVVGSMSFGGSTTGSVNALHGTTTARADLALRRANPEVAAPVRASVGHVTCVRMPSCRGPV